MRQPLGGLIAGAIIIYVYYLVMRWTVVKVAPDLLVVLSVLASAAVIVVYGNALYRIFGRDRRRRLIWIPAAILLGLIYADLAGIVVALVGRLVLWVSG